MRNNDNNISALPFSPKFCFRVRPPLAHPPRTDRKFPLGFFDAHILYENNLSSAHNWGGKLSEQRSSRADHFFQYMSG
jgi:hypothetical protein